MEVTAPTERTKSNEEESSSLTASTVDGDYVLTIMDVAKLTSFSWW